MSFLFLAIGQYLNANCSMSLVLIHSFQFYIAVYLLFFTRSISKVNRQETIAKVTAHFESGLFFRDLAKRVSNQSESQNPAHADNLASYLEIDMRSILQRLGFVVSVHVNPVAGGGPFLIAERMENPTLPTILVYGHGDVVRGMDERWSDGLSPWELKEVGDRWYGRGTADNKGQHSINIAALQCVIEARGGSLGFNVKILIETGEERGSPGLDEFCALYARKLAADVLIASDGPRLSAERPTVFFGSRGIVSINLSISLRDGGHHSGNWGGALRNPATTLAAAIGLLVDGHGKIVFDGLRPGPIPAAVRVALRDIDVGGGATDPFVDVNWGEPELSPAERVFAWNTLEVLAIQSGDVEHPIGAIPATAVAYLQLRYVVGTAIENIECDLQRLLDNHGYSMVKVTVKQGSLATRLDPEDKWAVWAVESLEKTTRKKVAVLPNLGGTLPNSVFAHTLALPTIWIPHSYPACSQHAPNEHLLTSVVSEGLQMMAGLFWDLGTRPPSLIRPIVKTGVA
jgi:acetylornithine deacetylase/succinyl-diaminopimelate desuccinylase-like protein